MGEKQTETEKRRERQGETEEGVGGLLINV